MLFLLGRNAEAAESVEAESAALSGQDIGSRILST